MIKRYKNASGYLDSHIESLKDVKNIEDLLTLLINDYASAETVIIEEFSSSMKHSEEILLKDINNIIDKANQLLSEEGSKR